MGGTKVRASFVGRGPELERTAAALARTSRGLGVTVLCAGEAGIGKTRLVTEIAERARASGFAVLTGGCIEMGPAGLPYGPFAEALRGAVAGRSLDPTTLRGPTRAQLSILVPDIADGAGDAVPGFDLAGLGQVRLFESVMAALGAIGPDRPVLLVIEDLHWADRSTLDLLQFLVRNIADTPTMILATVRTDELDRDDPVATMLAELARRPSVERIDLGPLDLAETSAQLAAVLGVEPDPALVRRIHRRSDGNPFFIEQLAWAHADGESSSVPASLRDILLTQLSRQTREVQDLLAAVAIAGPGADDALLASIVGCSTDALLDPLRSAVRAQLLTRIPTEAGEAYAFRHALMAEATEADLIDGDRRRLHGRCADALAARRPDDGAALAQWAVRIAHHRDRSGDIDAAISASIEAAIQTAAVTAHADAMEQYRHAIGLLPQWRGPQLWGDWDVAELYGHAAACAALIGDAASSARFSREAIASLPPSTDPWRRGRFLTRLAEHLWIAGEGGFVDALVDAAAVIPADPPTAARADALVSLGFHHMYVGDTEAAGLVLEEAIATAVAAHAPREEALARSSLVTILVEAGDLEGGTRNLEAAVLALRRTVPRPETSVAYMDVAAIAAWVAQDELALELCLEGIDQARRHGFETYYGGGLVANGAETLVSLGRLREATVMLDAVEITQTGGYVDTSRRITRALVATQVGDLDAAGSEIAAASAWPLDGDLAMQRYLALVEAEWTLERGQTAEVEAIARSGLDLPQAHMPDLDLQVALAWLGIRSAADRAETARAHRDGVVGAAAEATGDGFHAEAARRVAAGRCAAAPMERRAAAFLALASAERCRLHGHNDPSAWAAAAAAWDGLGNVLRPMYARIRQAEASLSMGRETRPDAVALLDQTYVEARAAGATLLVRMSDGIARRARVELTRDDRALDTDRTIPSPTTDPLGRLGLTERETEILALLAAGLTNRQIGERLFISPKTAGVHVSNILGKLDVPSRIQAATVAHRLGLDSDLDPGTPGG